MESFSLGRVFGVRIGLHWTVLIIFALIAVQLGASVFPAWHPNWGAWLSWSVALGSAFAFLLSIVVHELSHALVARAYGIPVRSINLFVFGGVANIDDRPPHARAEFLMAIVGPVTSFVLGLAFTVLSVVLSGNAFNESTDPVAAVAALGPVATLLAWVGPINLVLAAFNMIPGFPLDGGRVLRAILWWGTGDLVKSTRWAAGMGRLIGATFVVMGISMAFGVWIPGFGTGFGSGLWMVLIGWFLYNIASASVQEVLIERVLDHVQVRDLMAREPIAVEPWMSVRELVDAYFMRSDQHAFPVVHGDALVGLVCLEDVRRVDRDDWDRTYVQNIMTPANEIESVAPEDDALEGLRKLARRDVSQLPVVEGHALRGLFRRRDITRWMELRAEPRHAA